MKGALAVIAGFVMFGLIWYYGGHLLGQTAGHIAGYVLGGLGLLADGTRRVIKPAGGLCTSDSAA